MSRNSWKAHLCGLAAVLMCSVCTMKAEAGSLMIQFTGLDLVYDGQNLSDAKASNSVGAGNPADADRLTTMTFWLDGEIVGSTLTSNIFADVHIMGLTGIPAAGGLVTSSGNGNAYGVDLLTSNGNPGWGLALRIDKVQLNYNPMAPSQISLAASGLASDVWFQDLPFELQYDKTKPISFILSSTTITNVTTANGIVTGFRSSGTGQVYGTTAVPLPSAAWAGLGLLGTLGIHRIRKHRNA